MAGINVDKMNDYSHHCDSKILVFVDKNFRKTTKTDYRGINAHS